MFTKSLGHSAVCRTLWLVSLSVSQKNVTLVRVTEQNTSAARPRQQKGRETKALQKPNLFFYLRIIHNTQHAIFLFHKQIFQIVATNISNFPFSFLVFNHVFNWLINPPFLQKLFLTFCLVANPSRGHQCCCFIKEYLYAPWFSSIK